MRPTDCTIEFGGYTVENATAKLPTLNANCLCEIGDMIITVRGTAKFTPYGRKYLKRILSHKLPTRKQRLRRARLFKRRFIQFATEVCR